MIGSLFPAFFILFLAIAAIITIVVRHYRQEEHSVESRKYAQQAIAYTCFGLIMIVAVGMCKRANLDEKEKPISLKYEQTWHTDFNRDITIALAANNIIGCGEYKYKAYLSSLNEYIVYCSSDGANWQAYMVWPSIKKVMGPYRPEPGLD